MKMTVVAEGAQISYVLALEKGDEVIEAITNFAKQRELDAARFTAIGAFQRATVAFFDRKQMDYLHIPVEDQVEVLSMVGNIAAKDGSVVVHAHAVLGRPDGSTLGGHVMEGVVWPTLEVFVTEAPVHLSRSRDQETGLDLLDLEV